MQNYLPDYYQQINSKLHELLEYIRTCESGQCQFLRSPHKKRDHYEYNTLRGLHAGVQWLIVDFNKYYSNIIASEIDSTALANFFKEHEFDESSKITLDYITTETCKAKLSEIKQRLSEVISKDIFTLKQLDVARLF